MTSLIFVGTTTKEAHNANETYYEVGRNTDWQPFALLVDESKMDFSLAGFLVNLQLNGPNTVEVRNLKFVQYPDASIPPAAQATLTMPPATTLAQLSQIIAERERTYLLYGWLFILGLFVLPFGIIVFYLIRRARRIRHERELRRIASIDS